MAEGDEDRRGRISEALRRCGFVVLEAATPLEAIVRLQELDPIDLAVVGENVGSTPGSTFLEFVASCFPRVRAQLGSPCPS